MNVNDIDVLAHRSVEDGVDPLFVRRWSPRAMSGEEVSEAELRTLFTASRWAPSSYNGQPWRFIWAHRNTPDGERFRDLLVDWNRKWTENAGALVVICSRNTFERNGKPARTHSFDTGAAWMSLALQGSLMGLVVHGMQGFDYDRAAEVVGLPPDHTVEAMCAVGRPGEKDDLPEEKMREQEVPSGRKPLEEIAHAGRFPAGLSNPGATAP